MDGIRLILKEVIMTIKKYQFKSDSSAMGCRFDLARNGVNSVQLKSAVVLTTTPETTNKVSSITHNHGAHGIDPCEYDINALRAGLTW